MARGGKREGAGRKKGFAALEAEQARLLIAQKLTTSFEPIVDKAIEQAIGGDKAARDWLTDRGYGKAVQAIDLGGSIDMKIEKLDDIRESMQRIASKK